MDNRASLLLLLLSLGISAEAPIMRGSYIAPHGPVQLRSSPEGKFLERAQSRQFLVVDVLSSGQHRWLQVLGSDGACGWIRWNPSWALTQPQFDTTPRLAKPESPDSIDAQEWYGIASSNIGAVQEILGASRVNEDRDFPPRLPERLSSIPWLKVRGTRGQGWISGMDLPLIFHPNDSSGLLRSPFLARDSAPTFPALAAWRWNGWTGTVKRIPDTVVQPTKRRWEIPAIHRHSDLVGATGWTLAGGKDAWLLHPAAGPSKLLLPGETNAPEILSQRVSDLDGDGKEEWILEVSSSYGDGEILHLLVFDGAQEGDSLAVSSLPLGGSSGESPNDATASWKIAATANGPRLVVHRTEKKRSTTTTYRYLNRHILVVR